MFSSIGGLEILVILVVALLVLGPDHLPRFMRTAGKTVGQLRRMSTEFQRTMNVELALEEQPQKVAAKQPEETTADTPPLSSPAAGTQNSAQRTEKARTVRRAGIKKKKHIDRADSPEDAVKSPASSSAGISGEQSVSRDTPVDERLQAIKGSSEFIGATAPPEANPMASREKRRPRRAAGNPRPALRTRPGGKNSGEAGS
ncbi:Sec-independent protein translocase protein TatB [Desulfovibrio sp. OttesenSCG-928-I05]|nr:Sec-independent protein translocase protein TatB [Desulfovibrio sp. OttesenSCG-928-I05]